MPSRVRRRDVNDTTMGVVEAALADERAAKMKRNEVHDPGREVGLDQPSGRGGEQDDPTKLDVGPIDQSITQEMIAKAVKHRSLLRSENAARSRFRTHSRETFALFSYLANLTKPPSRNTEQCVVWRASRLDTPRTKTTRKLSLNLSTSSERDVKDTSMMTATTSETKATLKTRKTRGSMTSTRTRGFHSWRQACCA